MSTDLLQHVSPEETPESSHPDKHLFQPGTRSEKNRQVIYSLIRKRPDHTYALCEIAQATNIKGNEVYAAAHMLCKKNMAKRDMVPMVQKTRKGDKNVERVGIQYIEPWSTKLSKKW